MSSDEGKFSGLGEGSQGNSYLRSCIFLVKMSPNWHRSSLLSHGHVHASTHTHILSSLRSTQAKVGVLAFTPPSRQTLSPTQLMFQSGRR